jgi:hypothetical protein
MNPILTLKAKEYAKAIPYGSGDPISYDVEGMPEGTTAEIVLIGENWRYRRKGAIHVESALDFPTAQNALAALQEEVYS